MLTSRKEAARRFKKWITSEVIPAIRKTGGYMVVVPDETPEQLALRAMSVMQDTIARQKAQLATSQPKAAAFDLIADSGGGLSISEAAKSLKIPPKRLGALLCERRWVYRRGGSGSWLAYQTAIDTGLLMHRVIEVGSRADPALPGKLVTQVLVTARGMTRLAALLANAPTRQGNFVLATAI